MVSHAARTARSILKKSNNCVVLPSRFRTKTVLTIMKPLFESYVELAEAGHLPCNERPAAFNAALEAFLA